MSTDVAWPIDDGGGWSYLRSPSGAFAPRVGDLCECETGGAACTVTLPASPANRDVVAVVDVDGNAAANPITIAGNGHMIDGGAAATIAVDGQGVVLVFDGAEWVRLVPALQVWDGPSELPAVGLRVAEVAAAAGGGAVGVAGTFQASDGAGAFAATSLVEASGTLDIGVALQSYALTATVRTLTPAPAQVVLAAAASSDVELFDGDDGCTYALDARVLVNDGSSVAAWRVVGIVTVAAGVATVQTSTATADGADAGSFTAPSFVAAGATIKVRVTNPDATSRRWGVEASAQRLAAP